LGRVARDGETAAELALEWEAGHDHSAARPQRHGRGPAKAPGAGRVGCVVRLLRVRPGRSRRCRVLTRLSRMHCAGKTRGRYTERTMSLATWVWRRWNYRTMFSSWADRAGGRKKSARRCP